LIDEGLKAGMNQSRFLLDAGCLSRLCEQILLEYDGRAHIAKYA